jgi:hypothetical protein
MSWKVIIPVAVITSIGLGGAILYGKESSSQASTTATAVRAEPSPIVAGEATRKSRGNLALYIPAELAVRDGAFDLVVHFHGTPKIQEQNVDEARLPVVVVSVSEGIASASYGKAWAAPNALARVVKFAEAEVGAKRAPKAHVGRIALSSWSAGGASVKGVLVNDADRIDAVILADGLFTYWEDAAKKKAKREPLLPTIEFAKRAVAGEKLLIITHTAIPTEYPSVAECTEVLLTELDIPKGPALPATQPTGGAPTYSVDRGGLHVRGVDGKGPEDHIAQIRSLDDAYSELRRRWEK